MMRFDAEDLFHNGPWIDGVHLDLMLLDWGDFSSLSDLNLCCRLDPRWPSPCDEATGFIYVIGDGAARVKIGFSTSPEKRVGSLQIGNAQPLLLLETFPGTMDAEKGLHKMLKPFHLRGEWFEFSPFVYNTISRANVSSSFADSGQWDECVWGGSVQLAHRLIRESDQPSGSKPPPERLARMRELRTAWMNLLSSEPEHAR